MYVCIYARFCQEIFEWQCKDDVFINACIGCIGVRIVPVGFGCFEPLLTSVGRTLCKYLMYLMIFLSIHLYI